VSALPLLHPIRSCPAFLIRFDAICLVIMWCGLILGFANPVPEFGHGSRACLIDLLCLICAVSQNVMCRGKIINRGHKMQPRSTFKNFIFLFSGRDKLGKLPVKCSVLCIVVACLCSIWIACCNVKCYKKGQHSLKCNQPIT